MLRKTAIGVVLAVLLAGCGSKTPSADEVKSYQLTEKDLNAFAKTYADVNPTFRNLIPVLSDLKEQPFEKMASIKFPRQTADALKNTDFQGLDHFIKVYANVKLAVIRLLAEKKIKELEQQKAALDNQLKQVDEAVASGKIKKEDGKALKGQIDANKQAIDAQINEIKPFASIEVSQANLDLVRKFFFDLSAVLIKADDYETFD